MKRRSVAVVALATIAVALSWTGPTPRGSAGEGDAPAGSSPAGLDGSARTGADVRPDAGEARTAGRFAFDGLPPGCWLFRACDEEDADAWWGATTAAGPVDRDLPDGSLTMHVRAVHHDGRAFEGRMSVTVTEDDRESSVRGRGRVSCLRRGACDPEGFGAC